MSDNKPQVGMVDVRSIKTNMFDPVVWEQMKGMAMTFAKSGALPKETNAEQLVMKMWAGYEMGMAPVESIKSFYFVNGTLNIFGAALTKRLRDHGWRFEFTDSADGNSVEVRVWKKHSDTDTEEYKDSFTFDDAKQSGWTESYGKMKPGWLPGANRKNKLRYGVLSKVIKTYLAEVMGSATDIAEVAMDAAPVFEAYEAQIVSDDNDPATTQQIDTLKSLNIEVPDDVTKGQARQLISESINADKKATTKATKPRPTEPASSQAKNS